MPALHLLCGLPGSGKTTFAHRLASNESVVVLGSDEWMARLFGSECADNDDLRGRVSKLQWDIARQALTAGANVVLDWGFWFRSEREEFRALAGQLGSEAITWYFDTPLAEIHRRLRQRNQAHDFLTFEVTPGQIDAWSAKFEPPGNDEFVRHVRPGDIPYEEGKDQPNTGL